MFVAWDAKGVGAFVSYSSSKSSAILKVFYAVFIGFLAAFLVAFLVLTYIHVVDF